MSLVGQQGQESYGGLIGGSDADLKDLDLLFYPEVFQMREQVTTQIMWTDLCVHFVQFYGVVK